MKRMLILFLSLLLLLPMAASAQSPTTSPDYASLAAGAQGDEVLKLQQRLIELGLTGLKADGIYGKQTTSAVAEAQRLLLAAGYDVPSDGTADKKTQALLFDESARDALTTLRSGSKGERVRQLQSRLIDLKLLDGSADGAYGANTESAVRAFQKTMQRLGAPDVKIDGVASPALLRF